MKNIFCVRKHIQQVNKLQEDVTNLHYAQIPRHIISQHKLLTKLDIMVEDFLFLPALVLSCENCVLQHLMCRKGSKIETQKTFCFIIEFFILFLCGLYSKGKLFRIFFREILLLKHTILNLQILRRSNLKNY